MNKNIIIGALAVLVVVFGGLYLTAPNQLRGVSPDKYFQNNFLAGLSIGDGGTVISKYLCATDATWDPASTSSSTAPATLDMALSGATVGDIVLASIDSATSTGEWFVSGRVKSTGTTTIMLHSVIGSALNLSTVTAKTCIVQ